MNFIKPWLGAYITRTGDNPTVAPLKLAGWYGDQLWLWRKDQADNKMKLTLVHTRVNIEYNLSLSEAMVAMKDGCGVSYKRNNGTESRFTYFIHSDGFFDGRLGVQQQMNSHIQVVSGLNLRDAMHYKWGIVAENFVPAKITVFPY